MPDEILVVDNGSEVLPKEVCAAYPNVKLIQELTPGPGPARNRGVAESTGEILAFIDADCIADSDWLLRIEHALSENAGAIVGGEVRILASRPPELSQTEAYESIYGFRMKQYIQKEGYAATLNMAVRRDVFRQVGDFKGLQTAEDREWGQRANKMGIEIHFVSNAIVYHPARPDIRALQQKWSRLLGHEYNSARITFWGTFKFALKAFAMPISPIVELPTVLFSKRIRGVGGRIKAYICLCRIRYFRARTMWHILLTGGPNHGPKDWNKAENHKLPRNLSK